jgi:tetratricopeptide (TPR) repeat protein
MANATKKTGGAPAGRTRPEEGMDYNPPPSLPLQIFLLCAFLVTVAAYVAGQRSDSASEKLAATVRADQQDRAVVARSKYLGYTKLGFQAEERKDYAVAVSNFQSAVLLENIGEAHYNLGNALLLFSRTNEALKEFQAALALDPKLKPLTPGGGKP